MDKKNFPKTVAHFSNWVKEQTSKHNQFQQQLPVEGVVDMVIATNGHVLSDYLDTQDLKTGVYPDRTHWNWVLLGSLRTTGQTVSRKEAEEKVYEEAFKQMENKL